MDNEEWNKVERTGHFRRGEFKDDPYKIEKELVRRIETMRTEAGKPFHIHCAFQFTGHAPGGWHPKGGACDLNITDTALIYQVQLAYRHGFTGIGCYPGWHEPGIHVDIRDTKPTFWIEPADKKGTGEYVYFADIDELVTALGMMGV